MHSSRDFLWALLAAQTGRYMDAWCPPLLHNYRIRAVPGQGYDQDGIDQLSDIKYYKLGRIDSTLANYTGLSGGKPTKEMDG
jgi:hypothetical protein